MVKFHIMFYILRLLTLSEDLKEVSLKIKLTVVGN